MQATVRNFDPHSGAGDLLLDDGNVLAFPAAAFAASHLRLLRLGQRVKVDVDETGVVRRLTIVTLPFRE